MLHSSSAVESRALEIENCTKRFRGAGRDVFTAVDDMTLHVEKGSVVGIVGSNGAGKSTTLSLISGTVLPDSGRITVGGRDVTLLPSWRRVQLLARVRQNPEHNMLSELTVEQNFALALASQAGRFRLRTGGGKRVKTLASEALVELDMGLEERLDVRTGSLSGGQRQAIAIALATLGSPEVLLLDEHVAALDPNSAKKVTAVTERLVRERHITTLMVTHDMGYALEHSTRLLLMHRGRIILDLDEPAMQALTVEDLNRKFAELAGSSLPDATLLSGND